MGWSISYANYFGMIKWHYTRIRYSVFAICDSQIAFMARHVFIVPCATMLKTGKQMSWIALHYNGIIPVYAERWENMWKKRVKRNGLADIKVYKNLCKLVFFH